MGSPTMMFSPEDLELIEVKPGDLVEPDWSFRIHAKPGNDSFERQLGLVLSSQKSKTMGQHV